MLIIYQTTLDFSCVCDNGTTPDLSPYENTIPFYVCKETFVQCIANNPNNLQGQDYCKGNATCGTVNAASTSTSATSTPSAAPSTTQAAAATTAGSATASSTGSATGASASPTSSKGAAALQMAQDHSTGFFAAAFLAAFGMLL